MARPRTRRKDDDPWSDAVAHLRRVDPRCWTPLIKRVGPCLLRPGPDRFAMLVRSIGAQQISTHAAKAIDARLRALSGDPHRPEPILAIGIDGLRSVGLSAGKARTILDLAGAVATGQIPLDDFDGWDDDNIIASLTTIKGIGVWTAHMFLIFSLNRPDVWPVGDLGVRAALRTLHGLNELPKPSECHALAEAWRPYRTVASWYLWRHVEASKKAR
jgi:DNA-3-methyladenine glycosylase II